MGPSRMMEIPAGHRIVGLVVGLAVAVAATAVQANPRDQRELRRPTAAGPSASAGLREATEALRAGRFARARDLAAQVESNTTLASQALFVRGYALYKLGRLTEAARCLDRSLQLRHEVQVAYLRALVALRRGRLDDARSALVGIDITADAGRWRSPVATLLSRVRLERKRREERSAHARIERDHATAIRQARHHLNAGRLEQAARQLARAERLRPGQLITIYYRGYLAYLRGNYSSAATTFKRALALVPADAWSRYMLAMSLSHAGQRGAARLALTELTRGGVSQGVRAEARRALAVLAGSSSTASSAGRQVSAGRSTELALRVELGSGLDTNPAYVADSAGGDGTGMALQGSAQLTVTRAITRRQSITAGVRGFERAYAVGGNDAAQSEAALWVAHQLATKTVHTELAAGYYFYLFGHRPLLSGLVTSMEVGYWAQPWLRLAAAPVLVHRIGHDERYRYLSATSVGGVIKTQLRWGIVDASVAYEVLREWSDPVEEPLEDQTEPGTYVTDYTLIGHGPRTTVELSLPLRLQLSITAGLMWRRFDAPDQLASLGATRSFRRRDLRVLATAELSRPVVGDVELGVRFESLDNISSLDDSAPVDRNYARRIVGLVARWKPRF